MRTIQRIAIIGAGVMGAGIAAHLANAGIQVDLLDLVPSKLTAEEQEQGLTLSDSVVRSRIAAKAKERLARPEMKVFASEEKAALITPGNLEDNEECLAKADWIIEAVIERLDAKQSLFKRISGVCKPGAIVSSNTSGISINDMVRDLPLPFRQHFLGTHFFNPAWIMKLLEVIPGQDTLPEVIEFISGFSAEVLRKGVVLSKDTPNFIANRIGVFSNTSAMKAMMDFDLTVEELDALTGPPLGRPKSAVLRTTDMVGIDLAVLVGEHLQACFTDPVEKAAFEVPEFVKEMAKKNLLGDKTRQGFYKRVTAPDGTKETLVLDYHTLEYRPQQPVQFASLAAASQKTDAREAMDALVFGDDRGAKVAWRVMKEMLVYSAEHAREIAYNLRDVDNALKWGFAWTMGPFECWDALGVEKVAARLERDGQPVPGLVKQLLASGLTSFYGQTEEGSRGCFQPETGKYEN